MFQVNSSGQAVAIERNHYYATGLKIAGQLTEAWVPGMHWVNYGARQYDPVLMRFHGVDGAAHEGESPYAFMQNDFVNRIEVGGNESYPCRQQLAEAMDPSASDNYIRGMHEENERARNRFYTAINFDSVYDWWSGVGEWLDNMYIRMKEEDARQDKERNENLELHYNWDKGRWEDQNGKPVSKEHVLQKLESESQFGVRFVVNEGSKFGNLLTKGLRQILYAAANGYEIELDDRSVSVKDVLASLTGVSILLTSTDKTSDQTRAVVGTAAETIKNGTVDKVALESLAKAQDSADPGAFAADFAGMRNVYHSDHLAFVRIAPLGYGAETRGQFATLMFHEILHVYAGWGNNPFRTSALNNALENFGDHNRSGPKSTLVPDTGVTGVMPFLGGYVHRR
jgi:RHS repeat-associated protein